MSNSSGLPFTLKGIPSLNVRRFCVVRLDPLTILNNQKNGQEIETEIDDDEEHVIVIIGNLLFDSTSLKSNRVTYI